MKNLPRLLVLTAVLGTAVSLSAQTDGGRPRAGRGTGGPGGRGPGGPGGAIVRTLDLDHNHELSASELANATNALRSLDRDGNGALSAEELRPARPTPPADASTPPADRPPRGDGNRPPRADDNTERPRPVDPVMLALDANKDGALDTGEISRATASLKALDANGDGKLSADELRPLPPAN